MKYTYRLLTNPEMTTGEQEFVTGLLQAFELNPTAWTRIEDNEEIPEVCITIGNPTTILNAERYSMFSIGWRNGTKATPIVDEWQNYTAGPSGNCYFDYDERTHYF